MLKSCAQWGAKRSRVCPERIDAPRCYQLSGIDEGEGNAPEVREARHPVNPTKS